MDGNVTTYRCSICGINHPPINMWSRECCRCGEPTDPMQHAKQNITQADAESERNHRLFAEYLVEADRA